MHKAFYSLDALFSFIPLALLLYAYIKFLFVLSYDEYINTYSLNMKKLLLYSNYIINTQSVYDYKVHLNWLKKVEEDDEAEERLGIRATVGFTQGKGSCIVRYIAYGENKEVKQLFFCMEE